MPRKALETWAHRWEIGLEELERFLDWFAFRVASARTVGEQGEEEKSGERGSEAGYATAKNDAIQEKRIELHYLKQEIELLEISRDDPLKLANLRAKATVLEKRIQRAVSGGTPGSGE